MVGDLTLTNLRILSQDAGKSVVVGDLGQIDAPGVPAYSSR